MQVHKYRKTSIAISTYLSTSRQLGIFGVNLQFRGKAEYNTSVYWRSRWRTSLALHIAIERYRRVCKHHCQRACECYWAWQSDWQYTADYRVSYLTTCGILRCQEWGYSLCHRLFAILLPIWRPKPELAPLAILSPAFHAWTLDRATTYATVSSKAQCLGFSIGPVFPDKAIRPHHSS